MHLPEVPVLILLLAPSDEEDRNSQGKCAVLSLTSRDPALPLPLSLGSSCLFPQTLYRGRNQQGGSWALGLGLRPRTQPMLAQEEPTVPWLQPDFLLGPPEADPETSAHLGRICEAAEPGKEGSQ